MSLIMFGLLLSAILTLVALSAGNGDDVRSA